MGQDFLAFDGPHIEKDEIEEVIDTLNQVGSPLASKRREYNDELHRRFD